MLVKWKSLLISLFIIVSLFLQPIGTARAANIYISDIIPGGAGSITELVGSFGEPNWFAVSTEKDIPVYQMHMVGEPAEFYDGISIDASNNLLIWPWADVLGWNMIPNVLITVPFGSYTLYGGEPDGDIVFDIRARFNDYVSGNGDDLYIPRDVPQLDPLGRYVIDNVEIFVKSEGTTKILVSVGGVKYNSPAFQGNGTRRTYELKLNPKTQQAWTFAALKDIEFGVRLSGGKMYSLAMRITFHRV